MKLWLMFAAAYEEDLKTSEACLGALAGVCHEQDIAKAIEVRFLPFFRPALDRKSVV